MKQYCDTYTSKQLIIHQSIHDSEKCKAVIVEDQLRKLNVWEKIMPLALSDVPYCILVLAMDVVYKTKPINIKLIEDQRLDRKILQSIHSSRIRKLGGDTDESKVRLEKLGYHIIFKKYDEFWHELEQCRNRKLKAMALYEFSPWLFNKCLLVVGWQALYSIFSIAGQFNATDDWEKTFKCVKCFIVYDTVKASARSILKSEFLFQNVPNDQQFKIVDEVHPMFIDLVIQDTYDSLDVALIEVQHLVLILGLKWTAVGNNSAFHVSMGAVFNEKGQEVFILSHMCNYRELLTILHLAKAKTNGAKKIFTFEYLTENIQGWEKLYLTILGYEIEKFLRFMTIYVIVNKEGYLSSLLYPHYLYNDFDSYESVHEGVLILIPNNRLFPFMLPGDVIKKHVDEVIIVKKWNRIKIDMLYYSEIFCEYWLVHNLIGNVFRAEEIKSGHEYIGGEHAVYHVNHESMGVMETNSLEMRHVFSFSNPFAIYTDKLLSNIEFFNSIYGLSETHTNRGEMQTFHCTVRNGSRRSGTIVVGAMNQLWLPLSTINEVCTELHHVRTNKLINAMQEVKICLKNDLLLGMPTMCSSGDGDDGDSEMHVADVRSGNINQQVKRSIFFVVSEETCAGQFLLKLDPICDRHSKQNNFEFLYETYKLQLQDFNSDINTNELHLLPEFASERLVPDLTPDIFGTINDKKELVKSNNIITGNGSNERCDDTAHPKGCVNPNGLMKTNEFLLQTPKCISNTTSWLKQTSSTLTTRILNFCQSSLRICANLITHIAPYQLGLKSGSQRHVSSILITHTWLFLAIFQMLMPASTAGTNVTVQHLSVMSGQSVRLNCSMYHMVPVNWWHEPFGTGNSNPVYVAGRGIMGFYKSRGRHGIENGTNDLIIKNVTGSDAGKYKCKNEEQKEHFVYDIIILKSMPSCRSNIELYDVIGENDCGIDPDLLRLHCSIAFSGNFFPLLRWKNSGGEHVMIGTNVSYPNQDQTNYSTESTLTVTAKMRLNDTYFTCQVADSQSDGIVSECRTVKLTVHSLYNSSVTINMKSKKEIFCSANSNQPCNYQWTHQYEKYKIAIHSANLNFQNVSFGDGIYECQAECRLRGQICLTMPLRVTVVAGGMNNSERTVGESIYYKIIAFVLLVLLVIALAFLWNKSGSSAIFRHLCQKSFTKTFANSTDIEDDIKSIPNLENGSKSAVSHKTKDFLGALPLPVVLVEIIGWKMFVLMLSSELESARDKHIDTYESCRENIKTVGGGVVYQFLSTIYHHAWREHPRKAFIRNFYTKFLQRVILVRLSVMTETFDCRSLFLRILTTKVLTEEERERLLDVDVDDRTKKLLSYITKKEQSKIERFLELGFIFRSPVFNYVFSKKELPNLVTGCMREHLFKIKDKLLEMKLEAPFTRMTLEHSNRLCPLKATKLVDLLFEDSCINASQRQFIEKQPDDRSKAEIITDLFIHGSKETFFKTVIDYLGDTEQIELYYTVIVKYDDGAIKKDGAIPLSQEISQIACSENNVFALRDKEKVLYVYDDNQELCGTITVPFLVKSYGITYCSGCSSIIISDCENNCLFQVIIPEKAVIVKPVEGLSRGISTTMSDDVLVVVQEEWKNRMDIYRTNASGGYIDLVRHLNIPETIQFVQHASQTSEGRFVISCKTKGEYFLGEISETPSVRIARKFITFGPSINHQLLCIPDQMQVDECGRIIFHDTTPISRILILNPLWLESDLQVILPNDNYTLDDEPLLGLCYRWKNQRLIVSWKTAICSFNLRKRI